MLKEFCGQSRECCVCLGRLDTSPPHKMNVQGETVQQVQQFNSRSNSSTGQATSGSSTSFRKPDGGVAAIVARGFQWIYNEFSEWWWFLHLQSMTLTTHKNYVWGRCWLMGVEIFSCGISLMALLSYWLTIRNGSVANSVLSNMHVFVAHNWPVTVLYECIHDDKQVKLETMLQAKLCFNSQVLTVVGLIFFWTSVFTAFNGAAKICVVCVCARCGGCNTIVLSIAFFWHLASLTGDPLCEFKDFNKRCMSFNRYLSAYRLTTYHPEIYFHAGNPLS